jgi:hypothetical protein
VQHKEASNLAVVGTSDVHACTQPQCMLGGVKQQWKWKGLLGRWMHCLDLLSLFVHRSGRRDTVTPPRRRCRSNARPTKDSLSHMLNRIQTSSTYNNIKKTS